MTAQILDGSFLAQKIRKEIAQGVQIRLDNNKRAPGLAVIILGEDPASQIYVKNKRKACEEVGFVSFSYDLPKETPEIDLLNLIFKLNKDPNVDGILVQLPLPEQIDEKKIIDAISFDKDVDGFHPHNIGLLVQRRPLLRPCTPKGVSVLLKHFIGDLSGMHAVIIGASNIVGRPLSMEMLLQGCTTTVCHRYTREIEKLTKQADILITAAGHPGLVNSSGVKPGAIVVDVGINRLPNGKLVGDIDFESVSQIASWISPVPGGVGPMTVAMLLENTLFAANTLHDLAD